jgi:hypothetical protein
MAVAGTSRKMTGAEIDGCRIFPQAGPIRESEMATSPTRFVQWVCKWPQWVCSLGGRVWVRWGGASVQWCVLVLLFQEGKKVDAVHVVLTLRLSESPRLSTQREIPSREQ